MSEGKESDACSLSAGHSRFNSYPVPNRQILYGGPYFYNRSSALVPKDDGRGEDEIYISAVSAHRPPLATSQRHVRMRPNLPPIWPSS